MAPKKEQATRPKSPAISAATLSLALETINEKAEGLLTSGKSSLAEIGKYHTAANEIQKQLTKRLGGDNAPATDPE